MDDNTHDNVIRCLRVNFLTHKMLLPNVCVAEVTNPSHIEAKQDSPPWFAGIIKWRELEVPVLVVENLMNSEASSPDNYQRILILNAPGNKHGVPFLALGCQSIPSLTMVDKTRLAVSQEKNNQATCIKLDNEEYIIPDIALLEDKVNQIMSSFGNDKP